MKTAVKFGNILQFGFIRNSRCFSQSCQLLNDKKQSEDDGVKNQGWISRILTGPQYNEIQKQSHSSLLSDSNSIYELATHNTKCGEIYNYLKIYESFASDCRHITEGQSELIGSWSVLYENQDQAVHLWRHKEGYKDVDVLVEKTVDNAKFKSISMEMGKLCTHRTSVLLKAFSYWGDPKPRPPKNIYDLRRYVLRPGSMIEWGNSWAKGITYRREFNQDVGGFFSQVGQLYVVYHLWAYPDLVARKELRERNWSKPGWDTTVAYTVPLIKEMESRVMVPNSFSSLQ